MEAIFSVKSPEQKNYVIEYGQGNKRKSIRFNRSNGMYQTTDRTEISILLRGDAFGKDYHLITPIEVVDKWLQGEVPEKINKEYLKDVTTDGLINLSRIFNLRGHRDNPNIIREMLLGKPVIQAVETVVAKFSNKEEAPEDLLEKYLESGAIERSGPWYQFNDESITKVKVDIQKWLTDNKDKVEKKHQEIISEKVEA